MGSFASSRWTVQQQQSREGGWVRVLVQQIGSWLQRGKVDYFASSMKQSILFSCFQISFHRIFGWYVSIFVLGKMKEPKECLLLSHSRQKNIFLTGCWISLLESLLGSVDSSTTLYTPLPLLRHWQEMNCSFRSSWRSAWSNRGKRAMGRCFPKEAWVFCGGRCQLFIPEHTVPRAFLQCLPANSREALIHFWSSLVSKTVTGTQFLKRKLWKVHLFDKVHNSISSPIKAVQDLGITLTQSTVNWCFFLSFSLIVNPLPQRGSAVTFTGFSCKVGGECGIFLKIPCSPTVCVFWVCF